MALLLQQGRAPMLLPVTSFYLILWTPASLQRAVKNTSVIPPCGADAIVPGSRTWSFQWTAPATDDGIITFYLSSLASNHDHTLAGDYTYTLTKTLDLATDIQEVNDNLDIQIFPNPSHDDLIVSINKEWMNARITLMYPDGKPTGLLSSVPETGKIIISRNTWNLKSGVYFLKIESASGSFTKKIVFLMQQFFWFLFMGWRVIDENFPAVIIFS